MFSGITLRGWIEFQLKEGSSFSSLRHLWERNKATTWEDNFTFSTWLKSASGNVFLFGSDASYFQRPKLDLMKSLYNILNFDKYDLKATDFKFVLGRAGVPVSGITYKIKDARTLELAYASTNKNLAKKKKLAGCASTLATFAREEMEKIFPNRHHYLNAVPFEDGNSFYYTNKSVLILKE